MQNDFTAAVLAMAAGTFRLAGPVRAQGAIGSPSGTITLDGSLLPPVPLPFGGKIEDDRCSPRSGGRRAWCRLRMARTFS